MLLFLAAIIPAILVGVFMRANYRGHIEDLRQALTHERKMRRYEEDRAEALSDALFKRASTQRHNSKMLN